MTKDLQMAGGALRLWLACAAGAVILTLAGVAGAQARSSRQRPPPPSSASPGEPSDADDRPQLRTEPEIAPPADPLAIPPDVRSRLGTDFSGGPPSPAGAPGPTRVLPFYQEQRGDYRLRLAPPFFMEQTRGLHDPSQALYGVPQTEDTQGIYGLVYYRRRSAAKALDVVFPAFWRVREQDSHSLVVGPVFHREAPGEHDNWLAPLFFEGERKDGGYFHSPLLLTTSHWDAAGAFALVGPYFRSRVGSSVTTGVAPLVVHGDNGNVEGNRRTFTLIPPLLFYRSEHELDGTSMLVAGPVVAQSDPKRDVFDVLPFYFHIRGKPEASGVVEEHTTLFPFFHYGHGPERSLFVLPGYFRSVSRTTDTILTPLVSLATGRSGATSLTVAGPVLPLFWDYRDRDLGLRTLAMAPFFYTSEGSTGHDWLTPVVGRFETYGQSRTWWVFPSLTVSSDRHGWENDLHPIVYVGRHAEATHTVVAPVFWDFANQKGRSTVAFPVFWRFAEGANDAVVQVAANTLYTQKRVAGGTDWQFHLLPLFSYGESPTGYFWNVLFGLAGYSRDGASAQVRALWIPFDVGGSPPTVRTATAQ